MRRTLALWHFLPCLALILTTPARSAAAQGQLADSLPPGRLVDIGGYRLHLYCTGSRTPDRPTVVMSAGSGDYAIDWGLVQPAIAESSRVCSYDRAGVGWSDPGPESRTLRQEAAELDSALRKSGERGPFVLVGHSLGALVVRLFARDHPSEVRGMVLVDPTHEDTRLNIRGELVRLRTLAQNRTIPPVHTMAEAPPVAASMEDAAACRANAASATIEPPYDKLPPRVRQYRLWLEAHPQCGVVSGDDYLPEELAAVYAGRSAAPQPLGATPLIVIAARPQGAPPGIALEDWRREKTERMADLAAMSRHGSIVADTLSGHHIHLDNPALVIQMIRRVVAEAGH